MSTVPPAIEKYFSSIYHHPPAPASFSSFEKIWTHIQSDPNRPADVTRSNLSEWLNDQETHQVYQVPESKFDTEAIIVEYMDEMWDGDILQLPNTPKMNGGFKYLVAFIDLFSRYVWVRLLKSKSASETAKSFQSILKEGRKCKELQTDSGGEFMGRPFQDLLEDQGIDHIRAYGSVKANYIERWNRTFQDKLYRYTYENTTSKFSDVIDDLVKSYNTTVHSTTGFAPAQVTPDNALALYERVYIPILNKRANQKIPFSFEVGQLVRLSLARGRFKRGYEQKWSEEIFQIRSRTASHPPRYQIRDLKGENVEGSFYNQELKRVNAKDENQVNWKIERVIYTRKIKGRKKSLVKWLGFPPKFNTLIPSADLAKYPRKK